MSKHFTATSAKDIANQLCRESAVNLSLESKQRIRQRLLSEYQEQKYHPTPTASSTKIRFRTAPAVISVAVILVIGTGVGTAVAANDAKPGDRLFVVDRTMERVQLAVTPNKTKRAKLLADIAKERRLEHSQLVSEQNVGAAQEAEQLTIAAVKQALMTNDIARAESIEQDAKTEVVDLNHIRNEVMSFDLTLPNQADSGLTEALAKFDNNKNTTITLKLNAATATFQLQTQNIVEIEQAIVQRTGIDLEKIKLLLKIESTDTNIPPTTKPTLSDSTDSNANTEAGNNAQPEDTSSTTNGGDNTNSIDPPNTNNRDTLPAGWDITVTIINDTANIGISNNNLALFAWTMPTTDINTILISISQKTGLNSDQIRTLWHLETE